MTDPVAVRVKDLHYGYGDVLALRGISLEVRAGETFGVLGPNGSGKTTLFRILATILPVAEGHVILAGHDVARDVASVRRAIAVVFQSPSLDPKLTVAENLSCHGRLYGIAGPELRRRMDEVLAAVGIGERAGDFVETLSGGLQRRVELAKGLLSEPQVLILDEPSTGLDPGARRDLWACLRSLQAKRGTTILVTTHLMNEAEQCNRLAILDRGAIVATGTPDDLRRKIGGDVLTVRSHDAEELCAQIRQRWEVDATAVDGEVRLEHPNARGLLREIDEAFPGRIEAIQLARPTLEDVFIRETGHRLWSDGSERP